MLVAHGHLSLLSVCFSFFLQESIGTSNATLAAADLPPEDCIFEGVWKVAGTLVNLTKTSARPAKWMYTIYNLDGGRILAGPSSTSMQPSPPRWSYPCRSIRDDTQGQAAGPFVWYPGGGRRDSIWLALPASVSVGGIRWTTAPDLRVGHPVCPIADVTTLFGMHQLVVHSGGCSHVSATRVVDPWNAPLTEDGYLAVAALTWLDGMKVYIRRVVAAQGWNVENESDLSGFAQWYCGVGCWCRTTGGGIGRCSVVNGQWYCAAGPFYTPPPHQSLAKMLEELQVAAWVRKPVGAALLHVNNDQDVSANHGRNGSTITPFNDHDVSANHGRNAAAHIFAVLLALQAV